MLHSKVSRIAATVAVVALGALCEPSVFAQAAEASAPAARRAAAGDPGPRDPGRWLLTGWSGFPTDYWQGATSDGRSLFFTGFFSGLWRTTRQGLRVDGRPQAIPADVAAAYGFNHIGDPSFDRAGGGRLLLPLECYVPGRGNTCGQGAIAVADPDDLSWRYLVLLDRSEIAKAMWVEVDPSGKYAWTSSGRDLLAYRTSAIARSHAAPRGAPLRAARWLVGAVPPSGVTGGAFVGSRLFLAGQDAGFAIWSIDTTSGERRLEVALDAVAGESEGLVTTRVFGGELNWLIAPLATRPTFGRWVAMLHLVRARGRPGLKVSARLVSQRGAFGGVGRQAKVVVRVTRRGRAVAGAAVTFAGARARSDRRGRAQLVVRTAVPGRYAALARHGALRGLSRRIAIGPPAPATVARALP